MSIDIKVQAALLKLQALTPDREWYVEPQQFVGSGDNNVEIYRDTVQFSSCGTGIYDPYLSECGRFAVDPQKEYGLSAEEIATMVEANQLTVPEQAVDVDGLVQEALDAMCLVVQNRLGITAGDAAGMFWSGDRVDIIKEYIEYELSNKN